MLDADVRAAISLGWVVRVKPGGDNPSSVLADSQGDGTGGPGARADELHGLVRATRPSDSS